MIIRDIPSRLRGKGGLKPALLAASLFQLRKFSALYIIVKRTTGKSLRQFAAENIFQPLGTNLGTMVPAQLARKVATLHLGNAMTVPHTQRPTVRPGPANNDELVGKYFSDELQVTYRVAVSGPELALYRRAGPSTPMKAERPDTFRAGASTLAFQRDARGRVSAFTLDAG